jgi:hypothetical protein
VGQIKLAINFNNVLFPLPEAPAIVTNSPSSTFTFSLESITLSFVLKLKFSTVSIPSAPSKKPKIHCPHYNISEFKELVVALGPLTDFVWLYLLDFYF